MSFLANHTSESTSGAGLSRRGFHRLFGAAAAATTVSLALTACGSDAPATNADGQAEIRFGWWGSDGRVKVTTAAIAAFETENPKIKVKPEYGDWSGYWDKLATQTAGNDAPDVIQMDEKYIAEYASRGALLDLSKYKVDTTNLVADVLKAGQSDAGLTGIPAGINAATIIANPKVFEAAGVPMPDDQTWTWEDYKRISAEITEKSEAGITGSTAYSADQASLNVWLRQNGKEFYSTDGKLGFESADLESWLAFLIELAEAKAIPPASTVIEEQAAPLDQSATATGKAAMSFWWSNQLPALENAAGTELTILNYPSKTGTSADAKLWYKPSQFWSASARTKNPEAAAALIDFLANSTAAGEALLADRGVPTSTVVRAAVADKMTPADVKVIEFIDGIKDKLGPVPPAVPKGAGAMEDIIKRYASEVMFTRQTPSDAAKKAVDEMTAALG
ncbi:MULTISPECIES: ABC transporter substrate-binding protein [unclassified Arthrobacter]|uniref:ABC transporter substrate-binding protein n=1 Tax=unclassified Arthrobacter TaxID=235627 RepID=UPI000CE3BC40|nr:MULTISPECIES: extracellular solute-binding protein [unclassified Arthrobacter]